MPEQATVVLAHGAWADGSSWSQVIDRLHAAGRRAIAAALPLTALADDVAALERTVERADGPVVLVGHAYAGAVIGATRHAQVKGLIYAAALTPDEGETVADVFARAAPHPLAPRLVPDRDGFIWLPDAVFADAFAPQADERTQAIMAAVQRPIAVNCITERVARPRWRDLPSWYRVAEEDRLISSDNQHFMAGRMGAEVVARPLDHSPMVSAPDEVVAILLAALRALSV